MKASEFRIYPYKFGSKSSFELARALNTKVLRTTESKWVPTKNSVVINWGSSDENIRKYKGKVKQIINEPAAISLCSNKVNFFVTIAQAGNSPETEVNYPEFTTDYAEARQWVANGITVVGRTTLTGKGGEGIVFSDSDDDADAFTVAKLWTKYVPKAREFRVHVFNGKIIDVTEKKLRTHDDDGKAIDKDKVNWRVRSHSNGFVFCRDNVQVPNDVTNQALRAFKAIKGLTFGAFDIIYNNKHNKAYVLECNTAPGIEGTTLDKYVEAFKEYL